MSDQPMELTHATDTDTDRQPAKTADTGDSVDAATPATNSSEQRQNPYTTIVVGAVMLCIGILVGYVGRPVITSQVLSQATQDAQAEVAAQNPAVVAEQEAANAEAAAPAAGAANGAGADNVAPAGPSIPEPANAPAGVPANDIPTSGDMQDLMVYLTENTRHFKGDPDAPITIIEFSDFQCPYCSRFATEAGKQIDETYIEQGIVRFGYQHFTFLGEPSIWAAEASECAAEQDAFWPFHDRLVERVAFEGQRDFTYDRLTEFAGELGLDTEAFTECLESGRYAQLVRNESATAQAIGVSSTPTFLINGQPVMGAQPFAVFAQVIESFEAEVEPANEANTEE